MKVEIVDWVGQPHVITSLDPRIIGDWFAEHAKMLMSANAAVGDCQLRIWPQTHDEAQTIGQHLYVRFTQDGLLHLADVVLKASERLADLESLGEAHRT